MRLAWMTDVHLNLVHRAVVEALVAETREAHPDAVLIGGDIGEADGVCPLLENLAGQLDLPIFFVLGNHDFYQGSIAAVRAQAAELSKRLPRLTWLTGTGVVELTTRTALEGTPAGSFPRCFAGSARRQAITSRPYCRRRF